MEDINLTLVEEDRLKTLEDKLLVYKEAFRCLNSDVRFNDKRIEFIMENSVVRSKDKQGIDYIENKSLQDLWDEDVAKKTTTEKEEEQVIKGVVGYKIGKLFGGDLIIQFDKEIDDKTLDTIKKKLSLCQYIYFDGYPGGHYEPTVKEYDILGTISKIPTIDDEKIEEIIKELKERFYIDEGLLYMSITRGKTMTGCYATIGDIESWLRDKLKRL